MNKQPKVLTQQTQEEGYMLLHEAVSMASITLVAQLLHQSLTLAALSKTDHKGFIPLFLACKRSLVRIFTVRLVGVRVSVNFIYIQLQHVHLPRPFGPNGSVNIFRKISWYPAG